MEAEYSDMVLSERYQFNKQQGHDHELDDQLGLHASDRSDNVVRIHKY